MGTGINLTKGKTMFRFISSMLTWLERVLSVFFRFSKLSISLTYEFKAEHFHSLPQGCDHLLSQVFRPPWPALAMAFVTASVHVVPSVFSPFDLPTFVE